MYVDLQRVNDVFGVFGPNGPLHIPETDLDDFLNGASNASRVVCAPFVSPSVSCTEEDGRLLFGAMLKGRRPSKRGFASRVFLV